jgi:hypothetical protein
MDPFECNWGRFFDLTMAELPPRLDLWRQKARATIIRKVKQNQEICGTAA